MDTLLASDFQSHRHNDLDASQYDGSPNPGSPYDSFEFNDFSQPDSHFPHTPSYNGSYQNSPYSIISDLPSFEEDRGLGLFETGAGITITEEYDPAEFDIPSSSGLLTLDSAFMNEDAYPHVSVTPPMYNLKSGSSSLAVTSATSTAFDQGSPASSNGEEDDVRSRASSTSSFHDHASPRLDFTTNFDNLNFDSPAWPPASLPGTDRSSPTANSQKPQSPPQLVIPSSPSPSGTDVQSPPTINAPAGDGMPMGPQLHIVPATPVSGGGETSQPALFQASTSDGSQGTQPSDGTGWDHRSQAQHLSSTQNQDSSALSFSGETSHEGSLGQQQFLVPQAPQRARSHSDTSLPPPVWDTHMMAPHHQNTGVSADGSLLGSHDGRRAVSPGTVNMNDVLPGPSSPNLQSQPLPSLRLQQFRNPPNSASALQSSFGQSLPPSNQPQRFNFPSGAFISGTHTDFLTPDIAARGLQRSKSDTRGHRQSRSEDLRYNASAPFTNNGMLVPPASSATQEYLRFNTGAMARQYLHPSEPVASITRGHHRRASSGSRERPGMGGVTGWSSGGSSARASPYPSPSASPRPGYGPLPDPSMSINSSMMRRTVSAGMMGVDMGMGGMGQMSMEQSGVPAHIAKVNVTTPSTADASQKRRKQPANFQCPVPGCGSTFTRHFNLKGHLRSHAEEKPFQCKWPGCGKGFARQHDCKRHEQLHLNIRPYPCEGCKKNFARMDALNRHLRSEGGAECRKIQDEVTTSSMPESMPEMNLSGPLNMKPDPDAPWQSGGVMM